MDKFPRFPRRDGSIDYRVIATDYGCNLKAEGTGYPESWMKGDRRKRWVRNASRVLGLSSWNDKAVSSWYRESCGRKRRAGSR